MNSLFFDRTQKWSRQLLQLKLWLRCLLTLGLWTMLHGTLLGCSTISGTEVENEVQVALSGDVQTSQPVMAQKVELVDAQGQVVDSTYTDSQGRYDFGTLKLPRYSWMQIRVPAAEVHTWALVSQDTVRGTDVDGLSTAIAQVLEPGPGYLRGTDSIGQKWLGSGFHDSLWRSGTAGVEGRKVRGLLVRALWSVFDSGRVKASRVDSLAVQGSVLENRLFQAGLSKELESNQIALATGAEILYTVNPARSLESWQEQLKVVDPKDQNGTDSLLSKLEPESIVLLDKALDLAQQAVFQRSGALLANESLVQMREDLRKYLSEDLILAQAKKYHLQSNFWWTTRGHALGMAFGLVKPEFWKNPKWPTLYREMEIGQMLDWKTALADPAKAEAIARQRMADSDGIWLDALSARAKTYGVELLVWKK
jgi:hypothetical protein